METTSPTRRQILLELAAVFIKLGFTAFGGPAAHVGMLRQEAVVKHKWLDDQKFLDLLGATNLIPGPNSTEMCIHLGYLRAGYAGMVIAGLGFVLPAMGIVLALAWLYAEYGTLPQAAGLLYAVKPVIIAIIAQALWGLAGVALRSWLARAIALLALVGYFAGFNEIALLLGLGVAAMLLRTILQRRSASLSTWLPPWLLITPFHTSLVSATGAFAIAASAQPFSLLTLFLIFFKIGAVLYGSGYVLLAFLQADFVHRLGWLTETQLIDAIAIGQFTPGPLFTSATFIGYLLGGIPGALLGTAGIFLPSFIFVALTSPIIPRLRQWTWTASLLDGVNASSLGLMAAVTWQLGRAALVDWLAVGIGLAAAILLIRFKVNSTWLILAALVVGFLRG
jgi:chromate transporter